MPTKRIHRKPAVPKEEIEAKKVAEQMYSSLTQKGAPKATSSGCIMGACYVLRMLIEQAVQQGADKNGVKLFSHQFIESI